MAVHLCLEQVVGPVTEKQADLLHAAREDCERLQAMVDDILDLSRIEAGRVEMHRAQRPPALVEAAIEEHQAAAEEHGIQLRPPTATGRRGDGGPGASLVFANSSRTRSATYPQRGGVVRARSERFGAFEVSTLASAFCKEYQPHLFDTFRVPGSLRRRWRLSIAKEIQGHGGGWG
jgi:hypothetical protein